MAKILIVDDRPFNRQFLLTLLSHTGHTLMEAADGAAALEIVRAERPELVISDILMPTMDGFQFARQLRAEPAIAATAIIFYTATYREPEARELAEACGVRTVLPKPSDPDVILAAVESELGRYATTDTPPVAPAPVIRPGDAIPINRIDEQLLRYAEDAHAVEATFLGILDQAQDVQAARDEMRKLSVRLSQQFSDIRRFAARLSTLIEVMLDVNPERGSVHLLRTFAGAGRKIFAARHAAVAVFDETTKELRHLVTDGFEGDVYLDATDALSGVPGSFLSRKGVFRVARADSHWAPDDFPIAHPSPPRSWAPGWWWIIVSKGGSISPTRSTATSTTRMSAFSRPSLPSWRCPMPTPPCLTRPRSPPPPSASTSSPPSCRKV